MGSEKDEKKSALELIEDSIKAVNDRLLELQHRLDKETDPDEIAHLKKELGYVTQQLTYVKGCKLEYEDQVKRAESEEKRKKLENLVKMCLFAGIIFENNRIKAERDRVLDRDREIVQQSQYELSVKKVFNIMNLRYVDESMVEEIMNDQNFKEMEASDPNRLKRVEKEVKDQYERAMERTLSYYGEKADGDFSEKEERLRKIMAKKNQFELVYASYLERMVPLLESAGTAEEKEFFKKFAEDMVSLGKRVKTVQFDFVDGESDFQKGNGFTKELIDEEMRVFNRFDNYVSTHLLNRALETGEQKDKKSVDVRSIYTLALEFINPLKVQTNKDLAMNQNNELRKQMEMWQVYEKLKGSAPTEKQKKAAADDEFKAWAKLDRMMRMGAEIGGLYEETADFAMQKAQQILITAQQKKRDNTKFNNIEKNNIKEQIAALVLHQMIDNEAKSPTGSDKRHYEDYIRTRTKDRQSLFNSKVRDFANSPAFEAAYNKYMKGKDISANCIKFLANDTEKEMAKEVKKNELQPSKGREAQPK